VSRSQSQLAHFREDKNPLYTPGTQQILSHPTTHAPLTTMYTPNLERGKLFVSTAMKQWNRQLSHAPLYTPDLERDKLFVSIAMKQCNRQLRKWILAGPWHLFSHHYVQTDPGDYPASYLMGSKGYLSRYSDQIEKLTTDTTVPRLRTCAATHPLPTCLYDTALNGAHV